jgi:hypothetical protein
MWQSGRWWRSDGHVAGQTSIKALVGAGCLYGSQLLYLHGVEICSSTRVGGGARAVHPGPHASRDWTCHARQRLVVWGRDFSCKVKTSRARRRLVVEVPLVGNWSEMQPTSRILDVLPVWVLTRLFSPPCLESFPWHCQSWPSHCQWCWVVLLIRCDNLAIKGALIRALVSSPRAWEGVKESRSGSVGWSWCWRCSSCPWWVRASACAGCSPRAREWVGDTLTSFYSWL